MLLFFSSWNTSSLMRVNLFTSYTQPQVAPTRSDLTLACLPVPLFHWLCLPIKCRYGASCMRSSKRTSALWFEPALKTLTASHLTWRMLFLSGETWIPLSTCRSSSWHTWLSSCATFAFCSCSRPQYWKLLRRFALAPVMPSSSGPIQGLCSSTSTLSFLV